MHHFIIEFITGGGMTGLPLSESLKNEGDMMLQTLFRELQEAGYDDISITRDKRCRFDSESIVQHLIDTSLQNEIPQLISNADVIWLIAPETGDVLASLTELVFKSNATVIACSPKAIRQTANKYTTFNILNNLDIDTVETYLPEQGIPDIEGDWIIKPVDGVGGENCRLITNRHELDKFISDRKENFIFQPYLPGEHLSMSLLVHEEEVRLLSCNKQYIEWSNGNVKLLAIGVNEALEHEDVFQELARNVVKNIPGLAGYIGIDLIETKKSVKVVEINPRFTTALAGLSQSLEINITETILNVFLKGVLPDIDLSNAKPVKINV